MAAKQLPLLELGDYSSYHLYIAEFQRLYLDQVVQDPLGRAILFDNFAYAHICLKPRPHEPIYKGVQASWNQIRAERIGWIGEILRDPDEIRPNHQFRNRQSYLLQVVPETRGFPDPEFFYASVALEPDCVRFLTAFPMDVRYWRDARKAGKAIYKRPPPLASPSKEERGISGNSRMPLCICPQQPAQRL